MNIMEMTKEDFEQVEQAEYGKEYHNHHTLEIDEIAYVSCSIVSNLTRCVEESGGALVQRIKLLQLSALFKQRSNLVQKI